MLPSWGLVEAFFNTKARSYDARRVDWRRIEKGAKPFEQKPNNRGSRRDSKGGSHEESRAEGSKEATRCGRPVSWGRSEYRDRYRRAEVGLQSPVGRRGAEKIGDARGFTASGVAGAAVRGGQDPDRLRGLRVWVRDFLVGSAAWVRDGGGSTEHGRAGAGATGEDRSDRCSQTGREAREARAEERLGSEPGAAGKTPAGAYPLADGKRAAPKSDTAAQSDERTLPQRTWHPSGVERLRTMAAEGGAATRVATVCGSVTAATRGGRSLCQRARSGVAQTLPQRVHCANREVAMQGQGGGLADGNPLGSRARRHPAIPDARFVAALPGVDPERVQQRRGAAPRTTTEVRAKEAALVADRERLDCDSLRPTATRAFSSNWRPRSTTSRQEESDRGSGQATSRPAPGAVDRSHRCSGICLSNNKDQPKIKHGGVKVDKASVVSEWARSRPEQEASVFVSRRVATSQSVAPSQQARAANHNLVTVALTTRTNRRRALPQYDCCFEYLAQRNLWTSDSTVCLERGRHRRHEVEDLLETVWGRLRRRDHAGDRAGAGTRPNSCRSGWFSSIGIDSLDCRLTHVQSTTGTAH